MHEVVIIIRLRPEKRQEIIKGGGSSMVFSYLLEYLTVPSQHFGFAELWLQATHQPTAMSTRRNDTEIYTPHANSATVCDE